MRTPRIVRVVVPALLALGLLLAPTAAFASFIGADGITLVCLNAAGEQKPYPGGQEKCTSNGWKPNTDVTVKVTLDEDDTASNARSARSTTLAATTGPRVLFAGTVTADDEGQIEFSFDIPEDADDSSYTVTLSGIAADGTAATVSEEGEVRVENDPDFDGAVDVDDEDIADTGADTGILALGAILAVALGSGALYAARKRTAA